MNSLEFYCRFVDRQIETITIQLDTTPRYAKEREAMLQVYTRWREWLNRVEEGIFEMSEEGTIEVPEEVQHFMHDTQDITAGEESILQYKLRVYSDWIDCVRDINAEIQGR